MNVPTLPETLDRRDAEPATARRILRDLTLVNTLFGGRQAVRWGVAQLLRGLPPERSVTVLDVGAGAGDIARHLRTITPRRVVPVALDHLVSAAMLCRARGVPALVGDLRALPVAPGRVDIVVLSQVLHHLPRSDIPAFLRGLSELAAVGVVVADLRRSPVAQGGLWTASHLLRLHPVTRMDGITSLRKGFTRVELSALCHAAGAAPTVRRRPGWRLVACWRTGCVPRT